MQEVERGGCGALKKDIKLVVEEIEKHRQRLAYARDKIMRFGLSLESLQDPDKVQVVDSFVFRFSKMQDSMSQKLFPLVLRLLEEEVEGLPFLDVLNKLEKLNFLPSSQRWKQLRLLRNFLTHDYPWEEENRLEVIKQAIEASYYMEEVFELIKTKLKDRGLL